MGESNTVVSDYTLYRHLQQYCSHPSLSFHYFTQVSPGDTGWDVFSLDYHVDGPIRTVSQFCTCYISIHRTFQGQSVFRPVA